MTDDQIKKLFHDLKNDLAAMTALPNLHRIYKNNITSEDMLDRLTERQLVISTAYEKLYQGGDFEYLNLPEFIDSLLSKQNRFFLSHHTGVKLYKSVASIKLPVKKAIALCQILTELLSNSYRHAFVNSEGEKTIKLDISSGNDGKLNLKYSDNGCGFSEDFEPVKARSLGMQFIISLAKQLGANIAFNTDTLTQGIEFSLELDMNN